MKTDTDWRRALILSSYLARGSRRGLLQKWYDVRIDAQNDGSRPFVALIGAGTFSMKSSEVMCSMLSRRHWAQSPTKASWIAKKF